MSYQCIKKCLFALPPETAHGLALHGLNVLAKLKLLSRKTHTHPVTLMGLTFPNAVGLAAGLDKNADYLDGLQQLGFGFIEIGTVTPKPQPGNPKPRLFRLTEDEAIINRMGFNSKGADYVADKLSCAKYKGILGINLGKNKETPFENTVEDYIAGMHALWQYASYFAINISSPNTPQLRQFHQKDLLSSLFSALKKEQSIIWQRENKYIPLVVKIAPDLSPEDLTDIADVITTENIDGVIATNTTMRRDHLHDTRLAKEQGGLSGKPLSQLSTHIIAQLRALLPTLPIIAVGGIHDAKTAQEKLAAGANLLQIYTGFIYQGPRLIQVMNDVVDRYRITI